MIRTYTAVEIAATYRRPGEHTCDNDRDPGDRANGPGAWPTQGVDMARVINAGAVLPHTVETFRQNPAAALFAKWWEANRDLGGLAFSRMRRYRANELTLEIVEGILNEVEESQKPPAPPASLAPTIRPARRKRFIEERGRVQYGSSLAAFRTDYLVDALCEVQDCNVLDVSRLVFDHCHEHGWVRAVLCCRHNSRLGHLEAAMREWGVDLSGTPYASVLAACVGCSP